MHYRFFLVLAVAAGIGLAQTAQKPDDVRYGSISGIVADASGVPIRDAKVYDEPVDSVRIGKDHFAVTDPNGRFLIANVPVGKVMVIATKTEDGYPDARFALYSGDAVLPTVDVKAGQVTSDVAVKLLTKGGRLHGKIVDSRSGLRVPTARITLSRVDHPNWTLETDPESDGSFDFLIPARPMQIRVSAVGYKTWVHPASVLLAPREQRNLTIPLEGTK
jgi:hypothetical protein